MLAWGPCQIGLSRGFSFGGGTLRVARVSVGICWLEVAGSRWQRRRRVGWNRPWKIIRLCRLRGSLAMNNRQQRKQLKKDESEGIMHLKEEEKNGEGGSWRNVIGRQISHSLSRSLSLCVSVDARFRRLETLRRCISPCLRERIRGGNRSTILHVRTQSQTALVWWSVNRLGVISKRQTDRFTWGNSLPSSPLACSRNAQRRTGTGRVQFMQLQVLFQLALLWWQSYVSFFSSKTKQEFVCCCWFYKNSHS